MSLPPDQQARYIEIWSKAVETQMHFNEMCVRSRQLGLTFVAAALGVAVVLITRGTEYVIQVPLTEPWFRIHVSVILIVASALALLAVRNLDLNVYHRMLRGAVTFGEDFEENYMKQIFQLDKGMTQTISHYSRRSDANKVTHPGTTKYHYTGQSEVSAENKIRAFYKVAFAFLWLSAASVFVITNLDLWIGHYSARPSAKTDEVSNNAPTGSTKPDSKSEPAAPPVTTPTTPSIKEGSEAIAPTAPVTPPNTTSDELKDKSPVPADTRNEPSAPPAGTTTAPAPNPAQKPADSN